MCSVDATAVQNAKFIIRLLLAARRICPEIDSALALAAAAAFTIAEEEGVPLDISSFAVSINVSRSTASRLAARWEDAGFCRRVPGKGRTLVKPTERMRLCAREMLEHVGRLGRPKGDDTAG